ncbi:MAG: insulinase family protein, partial [Bacteroidota bacterium]|nr:insulinase family protein [Bacteroidota bacterium]
LLSIYIKNNFTTVGTYADFKNELVEKLAVGMLNMRFNDIKQKPDAPFAYVGVGNGQFLGKKNAFNFYALPKSDKVLDAVKIGTEEILRAKQFGYTQGELDRQKNVLLSGMKKQFDDRNKISSDKWAGALHSNFSISQAPAMNIEHEYKLYQVFLAQITLDDVNKAIKQMIIDKNTVITVTAPDGFVISENEILEVFNKAKTAKLTPYEEEDVADNLITKEPKAGTVVSEQKDDITGTTTWVLSNGIKVIFKPTDFKDNQILMKGYSFGGYSMYPNDIFSAKHAASIANKSGVGVFNSSQLTKFMSDKNTSCSPFVNLLSEGFGGNTTIDDFPTMMKLLYLYFTAPRFDDDAFQTFIQTESTLLANKANNPQAIWSDSLMANLYNHNPFMAALSLDNLSQIDKKRAEQIYKERFADPASFTFVFVGNIDLDKVKPEIEKYLASLPNVDNKEKMNKLDLLIPENTKKVYAKKGSDPKSVVYTILSGTTKQKLENQIYLNAISIIMSDSLLDQIRETKRWTYSISARASFKSIINNQYTIGVYYSCAPENVDKVNDAIMKIAHNFGTVEIPEEQLKKTIEKLKREYETNIRDNKYWLNELLYTEQTNGKNNFVTDYMDIVNSITQKKIKKAAKK